MSMGNLTPKHYFLLLVTHTNKTPDTKQRALRQRSGSNNTDYQTKLQKNK